LRRAQVKGLSGTNLITSSIVGSNISLSPAQVSMMLSFLNWEMPRNQEYSKEEGTRKTAVVSFQPPVHGPGVTELITTSDIGEKSEQVINATKVPPTYIPHLVSQNRTTKQKSNGCESDRKP
jgi:hypothetical protein